MVNEDAWQADWRSKNTPSRAYLRQTRFIIDGRASGTVYGHVRAVTSSSESAECRTFAPCGHLSPQKSQRSTADGKTWKATVSDTANYRIEDG